MTPEELTQLTATQQVILSRHDQEIAQIRALLLQQADNFTRQQNAQDERIAELTAAILDLRNLVADYIRSREQLD